ncbi:MAG: AsmA-like C-terminal region-containing protein [Pirellulaceae bacterium]
MTGTEADRQHRRSGRLSRWLLLALFLAAVIVVIQSIAPQTIGEQARRHVLKTLQEHYPQYEIAVGRGRYSPSVGLIFEDIQFADPSVPIQTNSWGLTSNQPREVLSIKKLTIVADTNAENLLHKKSPLVTRRVVIEGFDAQTWMLNDGTLSLNQLWPLPVMGPAAPQIEFRGASVRLVDLQGKALPIEIDVSKALLVNHTTPAPSQQFINDAGNTQPAAAGQGVATQTFKLVGTSNYFGAIQLQARGSQNGLTVVGKVSGAKIGPQLLDSLPKAFRDPLQQARGLSCLCDLSIDLQHRPGNSQQRSSTDYQLTASVSRGRFEHAALPEPITNLSGKIICQPSGITIQGVQGMCGGAVCRVPSGAIDRFQWPEAASFNASITGLSLNERLANSIPPTMRNGWDNLQPTGQIDIVDANLFYRDGRWVTNATVDCKGVDVRYAKFPYPIQQLVGRITVRDSIAYADPIDGRIAGRRVRCKFRLPTAKGITNEKMFAVATEGPVAIDDALLHALTPRGEKTSKLETFVRSLNPRGSVRLTSAEFSSDANGVPSREINMDVSDGNLRYDLFAYPLYNVSGSVRVVGDLVQLAGFQGANANAGSISCNGTYRMPPAMPQNDMANAGHLSAATASAPAISLPTHLRPFDGNDLSAQPAPQLSLQFEAKNIPMDESLRASLPESTRSTWDAISPSGVLDQLKVIVTQSSPGKPIGLNITGTEVASVQMDNRMLSIQPTSLPYRLDIVDATVNYDGQRVAIDSIKARHGATHLSASGSCDRTADGRWKLSLGIDGGSRVSPEPELVAALPIEVRNALYQLQLRRPVSVRGPVSFLLADEYHPQPIIDWDVVMQMEGNRIGDVGPVHDIRGELKAKGVYDARGVSSYGDVRIDSLHINDLQVTGIQGPYSIVGERLRLGVVAQTVSAVNQTQDPTVSQRKMRGRLFGGEIDLSGEVVLASGAFDVQVALNNGRVPELLSELGKGRNEMTGTINGQAKLEGILGTTDLLKGNGSARVFGANLYQLPLLVQLLNLLRIKATEDVAFTDADVEFTLVEEKITFNELKLWGDLVALQGGGTLDRRRELDLTFNTQVSPHNAVTHILRPLRKQNYTLWTVDVRGPLDSPTVHRSSLDGVGQTLERIFPGVTGGQSAEQRNISNGRDAGSFR